MASASASASMLSCSQTKMAASDDALALGCAQNADYAVICSFFEHFADKSGLLFPSFQDLQQMIENSDEG